MKNLKFQKKLILAFVITRSTPSPSPVIMHKHPPPPSVIMQYVNAPLVVLLSDNFRIT